MSFVDLGGDGAHEVEVPLEPVLDATHYKTTTLADLDDFDPALLFASLPQPYRTISKVLEGIWEESWAKIEERHPEVRLRLEEGLALSVAAMSAISDREPERPFRVVVSAGDPVPRPAEGDDGAAAPPEPEPQGGGKVAIVEVWPSDAPPGPRLSLLTTFETPSRPLALTLARDGRWLALTLSDGSTALHGCPDPGAKAPSRPATPAPAEGDELDEPPVEVPTFHFVGCYSAAEGCATDASVVERHQAPVTSIAVHRHKYLVAGAGGGSTSTTWRCPASARGVRAFVATEPALVACRADLAAPVTKVLCLGVAALAVAAGGKGRSRCTTSRTTACSAA
ncbi:hypothetical protein JL720_10088 [Aureococcus anophagefferens]|nr:hypothetical protein JL720_10088 [Aureococcus anophagefferens]